MPLLITNGTNESLPASATQKGEQMTTPIHALNARDYTDPMVFDVETAGVLAKTWQLSCHATGFIETGAYSTIEVAGENLFAIRGRDDKIRVFYNVCQHRAHQLVQGSGTTRVVGCPYHAWTYELTSELRAGPDIKSVEGFDKSSICLTKSAPKSSSASCSSTSILTPPRWKTGSQVPAPS